MKSDYSDQYPTEAQTDPNFKEAGSFRALRGGGRFDSAGDFAAAYRDRARPEADNWYIGLRLVRRKIQRS